MALHLIGEILSNFHFLQHPDKKPPAHWPKKGLIEFIDLSLRYGPFEPPVLRHVSFNAQPGEKVSLFKNNCSIGVISYELMVIFLIFSISFSAKLGLMKQLNKSKKVSFAQFQLVNM